MRAEQTPRPGTRHPPRQIARGIAGGALMGLANLVPGISGGTMLLAAGVYPQCIDAFSRVATLRPERKGVALLLAVAGAGAVVILLLAGTVRDLVLAHRWAMYSVFLGSTLGGIGPLWRLMGRRDGKSWVGAAVGLSAMVATSVLPAGPSAADSAQAPILFLAGLGAFAAMILPGLSGGYVLVLSGQYVPILGAVDRLKSIALEGDGALLEALLGPAQVLVPFALGGMLALAGISSLVRLMLERQRSLMLGFLLGLLAGAVLGLWPFADAGSGLVMPGPSLALAASALALLGFLCTSAIARIGAAASPS